MDTLDTLIEQVRRAGRSLEFSGPQPDDAIHALEAALSVELQPSYIAFLRRFGSGGEQGHSPIAGIWDNEPLMEGVGSVYGETLLAREDYQLPSHYLVIYSDSEIKALWCLDTKTPRPDGELPVVSYDVETASPDRTISPTFGSFFEDYLRIRTNRPGEFPNLLP